MYKVTFNEEPDERFWMENRAGGRQFNTSGPTIFSELPSALENESFQPTSPKVLKRKREMVTTNKDIQIQVQTETGKIIRVNCQVLTKFYL